MSPAFEVGVPGWQRKFRCALRGAGRAVRSQRNFVAHFTAAALVVILGIALSVSLAEWCLLLLCMTTVLAAEMFNTAIEHVARAITREYNEELRDALDTSSGAVLTTAIGAGVVGAAVFLHRLGCLLSWWT